MEEWILNTAPKMENFNGFKSESRQGRGRLLREKQEDEEGPTRAEVRVTSVDFCTGPVESLRWPEESLGIGKSQFILRDIYYKYSWKVNDKGRNLMHFPDGSVARIYNSACLREGAKQMLRQVHESWERRFCKAGETK